MGTKTWASASQPRRSSRCGQSVGTERKLPRWPQTMLRQSWLTSSSEHSNYAAARRVGVHDAAGAARTSSGAGHLDVAEAVEREARLEDLLGLAREHVRVELARAAQVVQVQRAVGLEHLGEAQLDRAPRSPLTVSRAQPTMFWPRSTTCDARARARPPRPGGAPRSRGSAGRAAGTRRTCVARPCVTATGSPRPGLARARRSARPSAGRSTRAGRCVASHARRRRRPRVMPSAYSRCSSHSSSGSRP